MVFDIGKISKNNRQSKAAQNNQISEKTSLFGRKSLFVCLRVDAGGTLEVTAEIGSSGKTKLICHLFDGLFRMLAYHTFCLIRDIVLDPLQWRSAVIICTENL